MKKITKEDWLVLGLETLGEHGEEALRIEKLCAELKVTKGSFYHHFKNIESYINELMVFWKKSKTENIIESAELQKDLKSKIEKLNDLVMKEDHLVEVRIRAWGIRNKKVQEQIHEIDQMRIQFLKSLYIEQGCEEQLSTDLANLEYASFLGMQQLFRDIPIEDKLRLSQLFHQLLNKQ